MTAEKLSAYISNALSNPSISSAFTNGKELYAVQCAGCHGSDPAAGRRKIGNGVSPANIIGVHGYVDQLSAEEMAAYISGVLDGTNGVSAGG